MASGNYIDRTTPPIENWAYDGGREWPTEPASIREERARRLRSSLGLAYTGAEIKRLNLFKALDASGNLIAETRRVLPLIRFVVSVDSAAIATGGLSWSVATARLPEPDEDVVEVLSQQADAVWQRSAIDDHVATWAWNLCATGDWYLEVVRGPDGATIVAHDARRVRAEMDPLGLRIVRAVIDLDYEDPPAPDPVTGAYLGAPTSHTYRRVLTPERVDVYLDGRRVEAESGDNTLGVVPLVRLRFRQVGEFELSSWAGDGAEDAVAMIDSMLTQIQVTGGRHANPLLVALGAQIGADSELTQVGRTASLPSGADLKWLEATLQGVRELGSAAAQLYDQITQSYPEFLFVDAGASASGTALSYRAGAFTAKIGPVRSRFYRGLSRALGMAVAMDADMPWSADADVYEVDGGSALPMDVAAVSAMLRDLVDAGLMLPADAVRRLMSDGVIPDDVEPAAYVLAAAVDRRDREAGVIRAAAELAREVEKLGRGEDVEDSPDDVNGDESTDMKPDDTPAVDPNAAEALADTALNGAQVEAAIGIVERVATGQLPRESGVTMLIEFFQLDAARAERVMGAVGKSFRIVPPPDGSA